MRFVVRHHTRYRYDAPVGLARHVVRLTPRPGQGDLPAHRVHVTPEPAARQILDDPHGNRLLQLEFSGRCQELSVESEFELHTRPPSTLEAEMPPLPWPRETGPGDPALAAYLPADGVDASVHQFAERLAAETGRAPVAFLDLLTRTLYSDFDRHIRDTGHAHPAAETLATGRGACRDLPGRALHGRRARRRALSGDPQPLRQRLPGPARGGGRTASPARLAGSAPAGRRLSRLGSDPRPARGRGSRGPVRRAHPARDHAGRGRLLRRRAEDSLDRIADAVARTSTVRSRVRRTIERLLLETREASAVSVARTLHMSRRTLSRKLEQEGTSFAGELDDVRRDLACGYIEGSKRSLAEIAFLLGFSHVESFHRAFRRWTGTTPSAYRTQQVAGP